MENNFCLSIMCILLKFTVSLLSEKIGHNFIFNRKQTGIQG